MKLSVSLLGCEVLAITWGDDEMVDVEWEDSGTTGSIIIDTHRTPYGRFDENPGIDFE